MKKELTIGCGTCLLLVIVIVVSIMMWFNNLIDDSLSKKQIFKLVKDNYSIILDDIEEKDFSDIEKLKGVQEVYSDTEIVDVYCGGSGFGPATSYYGFYYSPDNLPKGVWCGKNVGRSPDEFIPEGQGFAIKNPNDDNYYYTEKIRDNFFYYEAHF